MIDTPFGRIKVLDAHPNAFDEAGLDAGRVTAVLGGNLDRQFAA